MVLPDGSKEPAHGHDWVVTTAVSSERLDDVGVVMDFRALREIVENATAELDNMTLSDFSGFGTGGFIAPSRQDAATQQWIDELQIRCTSPRGAARASSAVA